MSGVSENDNTVYNRCGHGYGFLNREKFIKILLIHIFIFLLIAVLLKEPYKEIVIVPYLWGVLWECLILLWSYADSYRIDNIGIKYYQLFKGRLIEYESIHSIVVSNAMGRTYRGGNLGKYKKCANGKIRFRPYPWFTLCNTTPDKVNKEFNCMLDGKSVDDLLKKNGLIYSFIWNKWVVENLLAKYKGDFYITYSIAVRYKKGLRELIDKYKIGKERVHIIPDIVQTNFLWDKDF